MLKNYELMVILKPLLPEDIRLSIQKKIEKFITHSKGKILNTDVWGKRHLAYNVKKHEEGYYIVYQINMDSTLSDSFQRDLKLTSDILRFILFVKEK